MRWFFSKLLFVTVLLVSSSSSSSWVLGDKVSSALAFLSIPTHLTNSPQDHFNDAHGRAAQLVSQHLPVLHSQFSHLFDQLHSRFTQHHQQFHALAANSSASSSSTSTVSCSSALTNLQAKIAACGLPWLVNSSSTSANANPSPTALATMITTMCSTGTCAADISNLIQVAAMSCSIPPTAFASVQGFLRASCVRDAAGTLCLPQFLNSISIFNSTQNPFSTGTAIPNSLLNSLCSSCTMIVVNLFLGFSTSASSSSSLVSSSSTLTSSSNSDPQQIASSFNIICIKDPTDPQTYCINKLITVFASTTAATASPTTSSCSSSSSSSSSPPSTAMIDAMCSPCMRRLLFLIQNSTSSSSSSSSSTSSTCTTSASSSSSSISNVNIFAILDNMCAYNQNGQRCFTVLLNMASSSTFGSQLGSACANSFGQQACQSSCTSALQQYLVAPFGCCLGSLFSMLGGDGAVISGVFSNCHITLSTCKATTAVTASINLPGLSYAWCASNDAICKADLKTDISNAAYVSSSAVSVTYSPTSSGGTQVAVSILPASNVDAVAAQNSLNSMLAPTSTGISFTQTTSAAAASGGLIAAASSSGTIVSSSNGTTTAAGATNPSLAFANASPNLLVLLAAMIALAVWLN